MKKFAGRNAVGKWGSLALAGALGVVPAARAEIIHSQISVSGQQFATEGTPGSRVDLFGQILSESSLYEGRTARGELNFFSFFETGTPGDRSFDFDSTAIRFGIAPGSSQGHLWLGRVQPLNEGFERTGLNVITPSSAIGANWVQNQSNALSPRVSGWIGAGGHMKFSSGVFITAAYSPLFLPNFGPRLELSESSAAEGSRFASLPPAAIDLNGDGNEFPLRYRVETGDIAGIVLQPQALVAAGYENSLHRLTFMAWSAPNPSPELSTSGKVKVDSSDANVLVTATPKFARQNFLGAQWLGRGVALKPAVELLYATSGKLSASARLRPLRFFEAGYLTTVETLQNDPAADGSQPAVTTPAPYAKNLLWAEATGTAMGGKLAPSLRVEQHLTSKLEGRWLLPQIGYRPDSNWMLFANASILTGPDRSYFGNWKSLDSVSMGARYQW